MSTPVRVTADIMGVTVFHTKQATLEWTPDGRLRIIQVEPGEQPVLLLDTPPQGLEKVGDHTVNQSMLVIKPVGGTSIKVSLARSMLAPEPQESAEAYAMRAAATGVPPQSWWADSLAAAGVKVVRWGWGRTMAIAGAVAVGLFAAIAIAVLFSQM